VDLRRLLILLVLLAQGCSSSKALARCSNQLCLFNAAVSPGSADPQGDTAPGWPKCTGKSMFLKGELWCVSSPFSRSHPRDCVSRQHPHPGGITALLTRHVRDVVVNGEAKSVGRLPATQSIHFDVVLALRDRAGLQNFLQEVNDPATPFYRQFITPEEFTARLPQPGRLDALVAFLESEWF